LDTQALKPRLRIRRSILLVANLLIWGGFIWMGWRLIEHSKAQQVPGYPNAGQIQYYEIFPVIMFLAASLPAITLWKTRWGKYGTMWLALTLLAIFPYACFYTGGI